MRCRYHLLMILWAAIGHAQTTPYQWQLQNGLAVMPPASHRPAMAYDPIRGVTWCIVSSTNSRGDFLGTWRWDGFEWIPPTDASSTERRDPVQIVFDTGRQVLVLYCQNRDGLATDPGHTWEWDGFVWTLVASHSGPQNRMNMGMAFDSHRGRTVVFGGSYGFAVRAWGGTWEWDGIRWRLVATNGPSPRADCAMAYDAKRRVTILFGGTDAFGVRKRDTWTWDGFEWTPVSVAGPTARDLHGMVYNTIRERVLLYGGWGVDDPAYQEGLGDLWEWDGSQWILSSTDGPRHYRPAMAFDSRRGEAVVFGGGRNREFELRETWLLKLHETWVDFSYFGVETGTFDAPFNTIAEGVNAAPAGGILKIKAGTSPERLTISKQLSVQAIGGPVTVGQ
jgi:hypothetical protein